MQRLVCLAFAVSISTLAIGQTQGQPGKAPRSGNAAATGAVLAIVNGQKITEADLQRSFQTRQVPADVRDEVRGRFILELVDARLIGQFLAQKKVVADKREVEMQIAKIKDLAKQRGGNFEKTLAELGYSDEALREEFALPLAWKKYFEKITTPEKLRQYFVANHQQFDGTRVRARHVLIKVAGDDESDWLRAEAELARLRKRIAAGELTFEQAAAEFSDAPSKDDGGEVGWFPWVGRMPVAFSEHAFPLKPGELSQPFRTKYGVHLCLVTDRKPGTIQLEDVREEVLAKMSEELFKQTAADLRKTAKIEWKIAEPAR